MYRAPEPADLVSRRILEIELRKRGRSPVEVPSSWPADVPPLSVLARRVFPDFVLERRLRYLRAIGRYPADGPVLRSIDEIGAGLHQIGATAEDVVAWVSGASSVQSAEPFLAALGWSLSKPGSGPAPSPDAVEIVDGHLDALAGCSADPESDQPNLHVSPVWSRIEAATLPGDRFFGRRGPSDMWPRAAESVGRLGELKRRVWR
jgi:hypothetical protein